jgi:peptide/nickel transport system ATP-binding protein
MRQRIMIAIALSCEPDLLIADEPTTALDVTVQRQILDLLDRVRRSRGMGVVLISHDLGLVAGRTDRVAVMYAGRMVEQGPTASVFATPRHRYTEALLASTPSLDAPRTARMRVISGALPDPRTPPPGCRFAPRCGARTDECVVPGVDELVASGAGHFHACAHPVARPQLQVVAVATGKVGA